MNRYFFIVFATSFSIYVSVQQKEVELNPITITATSTPKSALTNEKI